MKSTDSPLIGIHETMFPKHYYSRTQSQLCKTKRKSFCYHSKLLRVNKAFVQLDEDKETQGREEMMKQRRQKEGETERERERDRGSCTDIYTAARLLKVVECCRLQIPEQRQRSSSTLPGPCTPDLNGFII